MFRRAVQFQGGYMRRVAFQSSQRRNFQKIVISNPFGVWLLGISRAAVKGIGFFYASAVILGVVGYFGGAYYIEPYQHICKDWSILSKIHSRIGVYYQDVEEDENLANHVLIKSLRTIAEEEGLKVEEDENKFKLLTLDQLQAKPVEWQNTYIDIVIRLASAKADIGDIENAKKLILYSINVPMNIGSKDLKSKSLRMAAKFSSIDGNYDQAESYLLDGIRFIEYYQDDTNIRFKDHGSYLLAKDSELTSELFRSLVDLGILYTRKKNYTKSLEIFLNLLASIDDKNYPFIEPSDLPLLKNYIGEILYSKGLLNRSIQWCNEAFNESLVNSRNDSKSAHVASDALSNLIILYDKVGNEDLKKEAEEKIKEIPLNEGKIKRTGLLSAMFPFL